MNDGREDVDERGISVQESFNLADFHTPSVTRSCSVAAEFGDIGVGDSGNGIARDQRDAQRLG